MSGPDDDIAHRVINAEIVQFPRAQRNAAASDDGESGGDSRANSSEPTPHDSATGGDGDHDDGPPLTFDDHVGRMNREWAFVLMGSRAVIMREQADAPIEDRTRVLSLEAFKAYFKNVRWRVKTRVKNDEGDWVEGWKTVNAATFWLASPLRRTYDGIEFWPDRDHAPGTKGYFNLWRGFSLTPSQDDAAARRAKYSVFEDHVHTNIANGNETHFRWLWHWFAHIVQRPRERIGTAIVLRGKMGTGKTVLGEVIGSLFASHYFLVDDPRYLTGQFNAHMASCLLLQVDEGFWAGDKAAEGRLKGLVTARTQMIESKGVDPIRLTNYVRLLFSSNESWVVPAGLEERRFAVFDVSDGARQNHGYFEELFKQLADGGREALLADLLAVDLDRADAPDVRVIPKTEALLEQKLRSLDPVQSWWFERLTNGSPTRRSQKWPDRPFPITTLLSDYMRTAERVGVKRKADETTFSYAMRRLLPGMRAAVKRHCEVDVLGDDGKWTKEIRRVRCWDLPPLAEAREAFEEGVCQTVEWPAELDEPERDGETSEY